jgi:hypothetical protein
MISDAASYMVKAGKSLNDLYRNFIHCPCLAHGFARVVETLRLLFPLVNDSIKYGKRIFIKVPPQNSRI